MKEDGRPRPVVLSFLGPPPAVVTLGFEVRKTSTFIPRPVRCLNCQRFGHIRDHCRSGIRCAHCGGSHKYEDCPDLQKPKDTQSAKCCNCGEAYSAAYRECKSYKVAKKITEVKTVETFLMQLLLLRSDPYLNQGRPLKI